MMIQAIETVYNGYRFRSRLEARWAVFFDVLGLKWEYELEGFELGDKLRYLPDFWLPQVKMWGEVKPQDFNALELKKAKALASQSGYEVLMLIGTPDNQPYWATDGFDYCLSMYHGYPVNEHRFFSNTGGYYDPSSTDWQDTALAVEAARQARFNGW